MSCYQESDSHIRDEVKVVLDLSNYATKEELERATSIDTSDLAAKNIWLLGKLFKLDINKLTNVPTSLDNMKTKVDYLDVGKLKTSCRLEKIKWYSR